MSAIYSSGFEPDPTDAVGVLAFVLCPIEVFSPDGDAEEREAVAEMMGPVKAEAIRRWREAIAVRDRN
jgi:hypothetical protein